MTRGEAIKELIAFKDKTWDGMSEEVIDVAIKALKQQPCDDAVSRQAVEEIINDIRDCISVEGYCAILERLKKLSPVTPQPKTGHWIWNIEKGYCKCSECGIGMGHKEFDYCPNCGAKMQESEG